MTLCRNLVVILLCVCRFLRIICIYIISGIGGFLLSGIFDPTTVSVSPHMYATQSIIASSNVPSCARAYRWEVREHYLECLVFYLLNCCKDGSG